MTNFDTTLDTAKIVADIKAANAGDKKVEETQAPAAVETVVI